MTRIRTLLLLLLAALLPSALAAQHDKAECTARPLVAPAEAKAENVAVWSANWAEAKRLLKEMSEIARAELVEAITARTGRRTVAKPGRGAKGSASGGPRRKCPTATRRSKG